MSSIKSNICPSCGFTKENINQIVCTVCHITNPEYLEEYND